MRISVTTLSRVKAGDDVYVPAFSGRGGVGDGRWGASLDRIHVPEKACAELRAVAPDARHSSITVVSMGSSSECSGERLRQVGGTIAGSITSRELGSAVVDLSSVVSAPVDESVGAFCEGLALGAFQFDDYRSQLAAKRNARVVLALPRLSARTTELIQRARTVAAATNHARMLAHEPANVINPVSLAARVRQAARSWGLTCTVLDHQQMRRLKMGAMLAVGRASATPPRLIVLEHRVRRGAKPVVLVGKAITFDTGGYSLKDKNGIVGMKYDKSGGTAVIGVMQAVAALGLPIPVVGVIAAAENMIGGDAYRPNDIVTAMSGKTVEIISTDAEGRLVLADALTYAQRRYRPRAIVDLATLTGGIVVALGRTYAGIFCENDNLRHRLIEAGERSGERLWPMPMHDDYLEMIRGDDCDLKNSATREGHACVGAVFLKQFVDSQVPWAHLDIAGMAAIDKPAPYCPKGGTGFGVRLLCDYLWRL